ELDHAEAVEADKPNTSDGIDAQRVDGRVADCRNRLPGLAVEFDQAVIVPDKHVAVRMNRHGAGDDFAAELFARKGPDLAGRGSRPGRKVGLEQPMAIVGDPLRGKKAARSKADVRMFKRSAGLFR